MIPGDSLSAYRAAGANELSLVAYIERWYKQMYTKINKGWKILTILLTYFT